MKTGSGARRLIHKPEALEILGDSKTQLHEKIRRRLVVAPVRIGPRRVAFPSDELDAIVQARIAGLAEPQMQALVDELHARRRRTLAGLLGVDGVAAGGVA